MKNFSWKKIKDAPKDETPVMIYSKELGILSKYSRVSLGVNNVFYDPIDSGPCTVRDATHFMIITPPEGVERD